MLKFCEIPEDFTLKTEKLYLYPKITQMKLTKFIFFAVILTACGTTKNTDTKTTTTSSTDVKAPVEAASPEQTYVDKMTAKYPGYTVTHYKEGKDLFEMHCSKCHDLPKPEHYTEEQWNKIVPGMTKAVNSKEQLVSAAQQENILRYVVTMTTVAKK